MLFDAPTDPGLREDAVLRRPPSEAKAERPACVFARVEIHREAVSLLDAWAAFETDAPRSVYQTRGWVLPWIETVGRAAGIEPLFVLARDRDDHPVALLCFGVTKIGPFRVATWIGGRDSNLNIPLMRPGVACTADDLRRLLRHIRKSCGVGAPDLFFLANQPLEWNGARNPFAQLPHQTSPSAAYGMNLSADAASLFARKLSKAARKKMRQKEEKLANLGEVVHVRATQPEEQAAIIDAFFAMKIHRLRARNIRSAYERQEMRVFVSKASTPDGCGIELHALTVGGRIVAVYGGGASGGQWSAMFNAFETEERIARSSPGDVLLRMVIAKACADGLTRFDLGIGEARYKASLCDERIPLFDTIIPMTARGGLVAIVLSTRQHLKRIVKNSPRLFALAARMRGALPR